MDEHKFLIAAWIILIGIILLFVHGAFFAQDAINDNGKNVIMDKKLFDKRKKAMISQQSLIAKQYMQLKALQERFDATEMCVREAAADEVAVTPCFEVYPTNAFSPKEHHQWLNNTTEY